MGETDRYTQIVLIGWILGFENKQGITIRDQYVYYSNRCMGVYWLRCINENSHHLVCNKMMMLPIGVTRHATILYWLSL